MFVISSRPFRRQRWRGVTGFDSGPEWAGARGGAAARRRTPLPAGGELDLEHDFVAGALAEDARSEGRQTWLGLVLAAGFLALLASGQGLNALALAFCLAPLVGIGLEIFSSGE